MARHKIVTIFTILNLISSFASASVTLKEAEDKFEFNYDKDDVRGPENWGRIRDEWSACGKGKMQSPVDLSDKRVTVHTERGSTLRRHYLPSAAVLRNRGHDIMLKWEGNAGSIWINGTEYALKQLHWHSPSEHTINGRRYSVEMHMVHETDEKKIAVVSVLYAIGEPDEFIGEMEGHIRKLKNKKEEEEEEEVGMVIAKRATRGGRKSYRYMGSLTVPPCTEGVLWNVLTKVRTVSKEQMSLLRGAVHDGFEMNARPVQRINDRTINLYRPKKAQ